MLRHRAAVDEGTPTYRDPVSGLAVFTAALLASRLTCCDSGCRHCPYLADRAADIVADGPPVNG